MGDGSHVRYHLPLVGKGRRIPGAVFPATLFVFAPLYRLAGGAQKGVGKKNYSAFAQAASDLVKNYLDGLQKDVTHFCSMFDYRNIGGDFGNSKDSIERSIQFLTSRIPEGQ